jgi:hypothetical protein
MFAGVEARKEPASREQAFSERGAEVNLPARRQPDWQTRAAQKGSSPPPILEIHESHGTPGWVAHRAPEHRESLVGAELATVTMVQSITVMS